MKRLVPVLFTAGCIQSATDNDGDGAVVPEFGAAAPSESIIGTDADDLSTPRDLGFNPVSTDELWTVNQATDSTVIYFDPGASDQDVEERTDVWAFHFMEEVSSIAFTDADTFATCQESRNTYDDNYEPNDFMGPALWSADLDIYAEVNQSLSSDLLGSHLDMLHQSPYCMGIAWDHDNVFWVFDGYNGHVVYYDFEEDHGPGGDDHADGIVRRYTDAELDRVEGVPGHMELDHETGWLYVADTGTGRVIRLDTESGEESRDLREENEPLAEFTEYTDATVESFADGFDEPSGLAIHGRRLFVGDYATGEIVAFDLDSGDELARVQTDADGLMGLEVGPDDRLWYVDGEADQVVLLEPGD